MYLDDVMDALGSGRQAVLRHSGTNLSPRIEPGHKATLAPVKASTNDDNVVPGDLVLIHTIFQYEPAIGVVLGCDYVEGTFCISEDFNPTSRVKFYKPQDIIAKVICIECE